MISYGGVYLFPAIPKGITVPPPESVGFFRPKVFGDWTYNPRPHFNWFLNRGMPLNVLHNPWGASRWTSALVLTHQDGLDAIREQVYGEDGTEYNALPLLISDGGAALSSQITRSVTTDLFMLPPVPIASSPLSDEDPGQQCYLLPLVCERFFWWEKSGSLVIDQGTTTWSELYDLIATLLGIELTAEAAAAAYLFPAQGFTHNYQHLPILLDNVAAALGHRIVRRLDGTFHAIDAAAGLAIVADLTDEFVQISGGSLDLVTDAAADVPDTVIVAFPRAEYGSYQNALRFQPGIRDETRYAVSVAGTGRPGAHLIHSTALANYLGGATPANAAELTALASQIGEDWYAWRSEAVEICYRSAVSWTPDGIHDVEWRHEMDGISTVVTRAKWEPESGELRHSGTYGSSDEPPISGKIEHAVALTTSAVTGRSTTLTTLTTLDGAITSGALSMTVHSTAAMPAAGTEIVVTIGTEDLLVIVPAAGLVVTILARGVNDTVAAAHGDASSVVWQRNIAGSGSATLYKLVERSGAVELVDTYQAVTVYNECTAAIADNTFVRLLRDAFSGKLLVLERCELAFGHGPGSGDGGGGTGGPCGPCADTPVIYVANIDATDGGVCPNCPTAFQDILLALQSPCRWLGEVAYGWCGSTGGDYGRHVLIDAQIIGDTMVVTIQEGVTPNLSLVLYTADISSWDCQTELTLDKYSESGFSVCTWPATMTVVSQPIGGGDAPTVDLNTDLITGITLTITGTNFSGDGSDTVIFNLGAVGTVTSYSGTTSITVTFSTPPTNGNLTAIVENSNGSSSPAVQVATVGAILLDFLGGDSSGGTEVSSLTTPVTISAGGLIYVWVSLIKDGTDVLSTPSVTLDGVGLFDDVGLTWLEAASPVGATYGLYLPNGIPPGTVDLVVTPTVNCAIQVSVVQVFGLGTNAPDKGRASDYDSSGATAPATAAPTATTTAANEVILSSVVMFNPGGAWTWGDSLTSDGQDQSDSFLAGTFASTFGHRIVSSTGQFDSSLTGVTPGKWALAITTLK